MKQHSTNYQDTFITVANDCPVAMAEEPPLKGGQHTVASLQFALLRDRPYHFTSDELLFRVYAERHEVIRTEYKEAKERFFAKGQACMRASPLPKRYGWGVHSDAKGRIALYGLGTREYQQLLDNTEVKKVMAMRSARK